MQASAIENAQLLNGTIEGNPEPIVNTFSNIEEAGHRPLCLTASPKSTPYLYASSAAVIVVGKDLELEHPVTANLIRVDDAYAAFAKLLQLYNSLSQGNKKQGIDNLAFVSESAQVDPSAHIAAFAYVGEGAKIGKNVQIYPHVYIGANAEIGDDSIIYPMVSIYHESVLGDRKSTRLNSSHVKT